MTGETQHVYTISDAEAGPKEQDKDFGFEGCGEKDGRALGGSSQPCTPSGGEGTSPFPATKDKEPHSQREAVIRPQQAGKIDFKSLHNKPKFAGESGWGGIKGSPQSPPGKGRARERSRRAGKGERGQHQLYRLSIASARPSPTIGIAYPQQKVTPPKAPEASRAPAAGSYRFHVPGVPEEEELSFGRCFPEAAAGRTSTNYTSPPAGPPRPPHGPKGQPPAGIPLKSPGSNGQLHYLEFQANGATSWPSPEKSFAGASYGVKPSSFPEGSKAGGHALGALPFQFPFQLLHDSGKEPYRGDAEYLDVALAAGQAAHGAFGFHASPREWQEEVPGIGSFEGACPPGRLYGVPTPLLAPPPAPHRGPLTCYKGRSEHPADPSGALSSSGAIDQNPSTFQENQAVFPSSLHSPSVPKPVGKGQASAKDSVPSPRLLLPSSPLRRNMPPNSLSQVHFQSKAYCGSPAGSASAGPVPFETSVPTTAPTHPRLVQAWEGAAKAFSPMDQNSAPYSNPVGSQFSFECQPGPEQRQHRQKNARMPWQQIHLTSAVPGQNRIELSRQMSSQKLPFPLGTPEWPGSGKAHKGPPLSSSPGYHGKKLLSGESLGVQHGDPGLTGAFSFENGKDPASPACDSRSKALFYSMGQAGPPPPPSRSSSGSALVLPPSALVAASPCESPLPSPVPNPTCGSTCSSLSPMSSSPLNPSFEDGQLSGALTPSPFFHHPCHPKEGVKTFHPSEVLTSGSLHYHPQDSIKPFHFPPDTLKDDHLLKCSPESPFHKPGAEVAKSCLDGLDGEPPPPPYASHHLLAGSLSSASLDQLDVLLTCKQCDQNYSNLASFLEHRQFCTSHPAPHAEAKEAPRAAEGRRGLPPEPPKPPATSGASLPLSPDPQAHLLALNKGEEFLLDGESKSDGKEDALKGGLFNGLAASSLPLTASDLDIDDAKLDSLITEALNGLGYQSDNPEIDSSFIDVFADEELTGMKAAGSGASHKAKEGLASESKPRHAAAEEKEGYCYEDSHPGGERAKRRAGKQHGHKGRAARRLVAHEAERTEPAAEERTARLRVGRKNSVPPVSSRSASGQKQPKKLNQEPQTKSEAGPGAATKSSKPPRFSMKEGKKRKPRSGTWSKELIHKIVQQKNKLHQLHAKSSKQAQLPLHNERLETPTQEGRLQEYEYVSDSEDEGAACSKLRGRRKRGATFIGRAKYSFSKKRPGRGERAKEKDPAWSYSRRRDRQKREAPGHRRAASPEAAKKGDCASRARRRSSQSSTGSNPSASVATEAGPTDLVGEKAAILGRRRSGSPARTPRAALGHPEDRSPKKSQKSKENFSRGTRQVGSAKPLLAGPRSHSSTEPDASAGDDAKEEPLPPSQEGQLPSTATSGRSPIRLPHKKEAEEPKGAANQAGEGSPKAQDSVGLVMVGQRQQFAPYTGDTVKYHVEELMAPSRSEPSPSSATAAFSGASSKYGKAQGLTDGGKGFATPAAPFGGDAVGMMLAAKAPDPYVSSDNAFFDPKGLPAHYDANLFSKPPALGSSHMDDMYLCREDISTGSFEQKHASISPYTAETPQTKVSSPLSFDSSSIFGELPVTEFDSPLYESVSAGKDGYVAAFACPSSAPSKPLPFEQPYPPFMPEKDWSLMEEVAPMLPEDMAHFHGLAVDKPLAKKFPEEAPVPPAQLSLPLPDRITDYNVAFMNNMSDDELEIKRLVTELESQLQTSKLSGEAPAAPPKGEHHAAASLRGPAAEPFPPLPADQGTGHQKGLFMADDLGSSSLLATKVCAGESLGGEKPVVAGARGGYAGGREPWHGPAAAFGSLDAGMCTPAPSDEFCPKDSREQLQGVAVTEGSSPRKMENESSSNSPPNSCAPDPAEVPIYRDPPAKSPPAVTNARMVEATEANKDTLPSLPCKHGAESFPVPGKPSERFGDAAELEKFNAHLPNHKPELGFRPGPATAMDLAFSPHVKEVPDAEERPFGKSKEPQMVKNVVDFKGDGGGSALLEEAGERKSPTALPAPGHGDKASKHKALLFHMLSLPKESSCSSQRTSATQDANPLQQLQLFVARTVKSNEEELLMPCFPVLLAPGHPPATSKGQPEQKEESGDGESQAYRPAPGEGDVPVMGNAESIAAPAKEAVPFPGACRQLEPFSAMGSYSARLSTFAGPELQNNVAELQHLANEDEEPNDINIRADGASQEQNDLSPLKNTAVTPPPGQGKKADQLVEEQEHKDKNKVALAFKTHEQSHLSCGLMEKETLGSATSAGLGTNEAERRAWCRGADRDVQTPGSVGTGSAPASPTSILSPSNEPHVHPRLLQDTKVNAKVPREGNGKKKSLNGCHYASESLASLPSQMGFSHPNYLQNGGTEGGESPSFSSQLSEENKFSKSPLNASSSFLVARFPPEADGNHTHHPTPSPTEQGTWNRTSAFPPPLHHCGATPTEAGGDGHHRSPEGVLGSYGPPEREGMARACAPLRADALVGSAVDGAQEPCRKDGSPPCSPFSHKGGGKEGPETAGAVLPGSHFRENQACAVTDMVINSIPPETQNYPTQPATDLLLFTEREVNLNQEKKLENCCDDGNKHRNEPEALSNGFVVQEVPAAVCRGLKRTGDLGPAESNGHQPSEAAEVRTGDLSKTTEIGEKSLEGEKPKSHRAEHSGEAVSCVLNNMGQGEGNTRHSTPSPSQNEMQKEKKPNGVQVTCDICSASFRSKPGLTRHKAVKHQVKPGKTSRSTLIPADETSRAAQKVSRRSLKAVKEKTCSSQVPPAAEQASKKICTGLEKEPSTQMQEVVSRVLSDLSVISLEVSQELHRTRVAHREVKAKGQHAETGAGEMAAGTPDPGRQGRKGEKGRRSQSKDPGGVNGNSEKKLNRKVRRRKAKAFPNRHEPDGPPELGKNSGPAPAALSPSLPTVTEGLHEPGRCISTEEPNSSPPKAKQSPCTAELAEDPGKGMVPSEEVMKEPVTGTAPCPAGKKDPSEAESTQACRAWVSGFVKQVEEGLGEVGEEQHCGADGTEEMEAETGGSSGGSGSGKWSGVPGGLKSPSPGVPSVDTNDLETPQKAPTHGALQPPPVSSPAPTEPKRWAKAELPPSREHHGDNAATSDLQGLFDDDPTFSQLFPRDDQLIRRKCTRVYGKRSKKPKPVTEVSLRPAGAIDLFSIRLASDLSDTGSFCVTREDPCEYETISVDDALMLNMCHGSKAKSGEAGPGGSTSTALRSDSEKASPGRDVTDLEDNVLTFLCQNSHMDNGPSLSIWAGLEKEGESLSAEEMFEASVGLENEHSLGETSSEPPDLAEEPYDGKSSEDSDSPEFHTIDIEMLNAKLKMRDVCFFGSCEELPGSRDDDASSFKPKPGQHSKHGRSKLEDGKLGKNRGDITVKAKDKQYKCKVCFQWFLTLGELDFHKLTHNPSPPPTCYMCVQRKFSSREQLRDHLKEKHAKNKAGLWACGMCLKEISDVWMYNEHLREHATQFARKGQAQKSVMGLPACFGEDNDAVTQFLNTIMCRKPSRSSRHAEPSSKHTPSRESRSPRELPPEQEAKAVKEPSESSVKVKPPAPSSSKASASPSPEHPAKSEGTPKSVPMHPDCKDPSRDCHHCGKQFPKPFKLQRHLVVHSLQKIYLCHKCPMFYQETKELRNHLSQEHGIVEEQEIKHTTLYACELCADVMHVIKKSFICSMCNYTFSKKEQYDRHMEKHLAGSNRTFKFRGVMRPGAASREGREKVREDGVPPSKKRKVAPHGTSPVHLAHAGDLQLVEAVSPSLQPPSDPFPVAPRDPAAPLPQPPVKTEDLVGDFSDLLAEMEKSQFDTLPPPPCLSPSLPQAAASGAELGHIAALSIEELEKGAFDGKPLPFLDSPGFSMDLAGLACNQATDQKLSPPHLTEKCGYADAHKRTSVSNKDEYTAGGLGNPDAATDAVDGIPFLQLAKKVSELPSQGAEAPPAKEAHRTQWGTPSASEASSWEGASKATSPEAAQQPLPLKDKTASPALNRAAKDSAPQKKTTGNQSGGEAAPEEGQQGGAVKDKSVPDASTKESSAGTRDHGGNPSRSSGHQLRGDSAGHAGKLHLKRRKEHKSLSHRCSAGSRENMEGDGKKKKGRAPGPGRSESSGELKRADWSIAETPALSPGRRDAHGNRLLPRPKMGTQLKKVVLDACNQKKGELRHANGDVRRRKAILGKSLHQVLAKGTAPAPRGSLHGPRPARGTKPAGSASYRTAESQNNLLSQLFGQKLTSFKIPLRRDTSE
ncbi:zinc finger protein 469 [Cygnus olor]|uniref:zinc finger protein 469 n=1 Tax=Cygnus olor TaxID=8869 RepID=UPI001ADE5879|nr:zinc finger protein 469 [Cygnus olor]XP_040427436.1 zinc finger protein 469 [Cygnus olor]XP_040427437.1 zinc finger protein 469 [Cygnus olor]XP_040427438.1 zinc finger protein 469 [Cygnus olor]XP_040427439.1 zinc finger protein 469 [Cygnus olor]XP_040427440.1 zinc finger protein 469 [Cygnus olor]XP_040427442.1 zinc finger protein 469 [Cygnus olor]XP_040427443.1 zinc finger protein 469 [Cygnus olor]XP_040427444.1 zinc finger protein 469 [Cygnus olor]XP_040427445.1 zinc finger protein 469